LGLGLFISSWVSSEDKAMSIIPFALIPQIVFALALLPLPAGIAWISYFVASRWSMESYGTITQFLPPRDPSTGNVFPTVSYDRGAGHVLTTWAILIGYTMLMLALTAWMLKRKDEVE
jgi:ABC-type transport system involved in multi-copper enzyme maturation permease subunit